MSKQGLRSGAVALGSAVTLGLAGLWTGTAGAAGAAVGPPSLSGVQAKAAAAITLRVNDLTAAMAKVNGAKDLGPDAATLDAFLQRDIAPLPALSQKIAGDSAVAEAAADAATVYTDFRVLALVLPAADLAGRADAIDVTAIPALTAVAAKAQARVTPSNQAVLQPLIGDLRAQTTAAANGTSGVAASVLGGTPAAWNANHDLLAPARGSVQAAEANITRARSDVKEIRSLHPTAPTTAAPTTATTAP
jgi:hypothetical protein